MEFHGLGVTEQEQGSKTVMLIADLAMITGNIGRPGVGVNPLRGQNNVQGAADMGCQPHQGAGYFEVSDKKVQDFYTEKYGVVHPTKAGLKIPEIFDSAINKEVKAVWIIGEDIVQTDPNSQHVIDAMNSLELLVVQEIFMSGLDNLESEKYLQAQSDFKQVVIRGTGSDLGDDAQYYLGEAYYRNEEYLLAVSEYENLTRRLGFSPFVEDARFKLCEAYRIESPKYYHDQEYTEKALDRYQEFLDDFPNPPFIDDVVLSIEILREKLGKKVYETGILYMKMEEYESAKMTFQQVIDQYYDTGIIYDSHQGMVLALANNREIEEALAFLNDYKMELMGDGHYDLAQETIEDIQKIIAKEQQ